MRVRTPIKIGAFFLFCAMLAGAYLCVRFYSFVFGPTVTGEVLAIERFSASASDNDTMDPDPVHLHSPSFSVAIKNAGGEIYAVSTKDRQWAVVDKGDCVKAVLFAFPPWDRQRSGTYFGARLKGLRKDCSKPT